MNKLQSNLIGKRKTVFIFILLTFCGQLMVSCYKKPPQNEQNRFKASIDLISYRDNTIQFFYKMKADDRYTEELSLKKNVKAGAALQHIVFELPHGIKPKNI